MFGFFRLRRRAGAGPAFLLTAESAGDARRCPPRPIRTTGRPNQTNQNNIALSWNGRRPCRSRASQPLPNASAGRVGDAGCGQGARCAFADGPQHLFKTRHGRRWADPGGRHSTTNAAAECGRGGVGMSRAAGQSERPT